MRIPKSHVIRNSEGLVVAGLNNIGFCIRYPGIIPGSKDNPDSQYEDHSSTTNELRLYLAQLDIAMERSVLSYISIKQQMIDAINYAQAKDDEVVE